VLSSHGTPVAKAPKLFATAMLIVLEPLAVDIFSARNDLIRSPARHTKPDGRDDMERSSTSTKQVF
jgi:hypothetical protein